MWSNDVNAVFDWGGVQAGIYILAITSPPPLRVTYGGQTLWA